MPVPEQDLPARPPNASIVEMNGLVLPTHANVLGSVFGGQVMAWIDLCAAMSAMRHAGAQCVTASMDALDFIQPIKVGHVVNLRSMVNYVGRTSMEVGVRVEAGSPMADTREHVASAYLTFVAVTAEGKATAVPPLSIESATERLRFEEGAARRAQRLQLATERRRLRDQHDQRQRDGADTEDSG